MKTRLKLSLTFALTFAFTFALTACKVQTTGGGNDKSGSGSPSSANSGTTTGSGGGANAPVAQGTSSSGGGGNGIDGKPMESYAKRIQDLPEYKAYIAPILRSLSSGQPDLIVSYLNWAADHKAWYFVPRELGQLPQDRIGLAISTEQLALQNTKEIFIYAPTYRQKSLEERAHLLLHEMIMGARLLMKQPLLTQCLAISLKPENCKNPETANFAVEPKFTDQERDIMDGSDHESIRALTVDLLGRNLDLSKITSRRMELGFRTPWDNSASKIDFEMLTKILDRTALAGVKFAPADQTSLPNQSDLSNQECVYQQSQWNGISQLNFIIGVKGPSTSDSQNMSPGQAISEWRASLGGGISYNTGGISYTKEVFKWGTTRSYAYPSTNSFAIGNATENSFKATPKLSTGANPTRVNMIELTGDFSGQNPFYFIDSKERGIQNKLAKVVFTISNDEEPVLLDFQLRTMRIYFHTPENPSFSAGEYDLVDAQDIKPITCLRK